MTNKRRFGFAGREGEIQRGSHLIMKKPLAYGLKKLRNTKDYAKCDGDVRKKGRTRTDTGDKVGVDFLVPEPKS